MNKINYVAMGSVVFLIVAGCYTLVAEFVSILPQPAVRGILYQGIQDLDSYWMGALDRLSQEDVSMAAGLRSLLVFVAIVLTVVVGAVVLYLGIVFVVVGCLDLIRFMFALDTHSVCHDIWEGTKDMFFAAWGFSATPIIVWVLGWAWFGFEFELSDMAFFLIALGGGLIIWVGYLHLRLISLMFEFMKDQEGR